LSQDLRDLLGLLDKHQVHYMVVGGFAVTAHGIPRYTKDLDVWLACSRENATKVIAALDEFGFASLARPHDDSTDDGETRNRTGAPEIPPG
jgi:hypothetical protein